MNLRMKGKMIKPKGNNYFSGNQGHIRVIPSVVQIKVDPKKDVKVSGEGVKKLSRTDPDKQKTKFQRFANFSL
jgi:hypothetical protein